MRWMVAVLTGTAVSLPLAWLLSHAALLPFFLGLFFFALFGLITGALMHRVASPGRPYGAGHLLAGTTWIVLLIMVVSLRQEAQDQPAKLAESASQRVRDIGDRPTSAYVAETADRIRGVWKARHGSGGLVGYVRWVLSGGTIEEGVLEGIPTALRSGVSGLWWVVRVALSAGLLAFGVSSQTLALRWSHDRGVRRRSADAGAGAAAAEGA